MLLSCIYPSERASVDVFLSEVRLVSRLPDVPLSQGPCLGHHVAFIRVTFVPCGFLTAPLGCDSLRLAVLLTTTAVLKCPVVCFLSLCVVCVMVSS